MALFVGPIIDNVLQILRTRTPDLLDKRKPFVYYGRQFAGVVMNFPSVWVMPLRTAFDAEQEQMRHQAHQIQVLFAVSEATPEETSNAALDYMRAIDRALTASDPGDWQGLIQAGSILRVFVQAHDFGPLYQQGQQQARFPELELLVETVEEYDDGAEISL